jgi:hypothetical protein
MKITNQLSLKDINKLLKNNLSCLNGEIVVKMPELNLNKGAINRPTIIITWQNQKGLKEIEERCFNIDQELIDKIKNRLKYGKYKIK